MNIELLTQISKDLKIVQFKGEHIKNYSNRVLYSSFSMWLKTICLDDISEHSQKTHSISKNHLHIRGEFILNNILDFFPESKEWFFCNTKEHPVNFMRDRLISSFDILELNGQRRLSLSKNEERQASNYYLKIFGLPNDFNFSSGLSLIKRIGNSNECTNKYYDIQLFYENLIYNVRFQKDEYKQEKEYYNPLIKTDTIYQSWVEKPPKLDMYISRICNNLTGANTYLMEKIIDNNVYCTVIDEAIIETKLLTKILFLIREMNDNPIKVTIEKHEDFFVLKRYVNTFGGEEEAFVQSFGWPMDSLYDFKNWSFPICFYDEIIEILTNLHLKIQEV